MTAAELRVRFAATLISEFVVAQNEHRRVRLDPERRVQIELDAAALARHLEESGALAD